MARHLNDETAEFRMPGPARHAAEDGDHQESEATQRFDPGFRERPRPAPPAPPAGREPDSP